MGLIEIIAQYIIPALFALGALYLYPIIKRYNAEKYVKTAVYAAEQLFKSGLVKDRLEYVKQTVAEKVNMKEEDLNLLIESFVTEVNALKKTNTKK